MRFVYTAGVVLLDLDQRTLPGIAHQVVEQMIISDQIRAEDRANVLRALLLKHRSANTHTHTQRDQKKIQNSLGSFFIEKIPLEVSASLMGMM